MKTAPLLLFALLAAAAAHADGTASDGGRFEPIGTDYKKPEVLTDTFFNPFKVQVESTFAKKDGTAVTNEKVAAAIGHRGISGIVYSPDGRATRAIIGDDVFAVGDELSFSDANKPEGMPLVLGVSVVLREVGAHGLGVDVSADGETTRRVNVPLGNFSKP